MLWGKTRMMIFPMVKLFRDLLLLTCLGFSQVQAVVVYDGTAANLEAPIDDPGWTSVGAFTVSGKVGSAVFLGNHGGSAWFLTANHVPTTGNTLEIASQTYSEFFDVQQIGTADLKVFRLNSEITGIPAIKLATSAPVLGASTVMIGYGATGTKVNWNTATNPWTVGGSGAGGYTWSGPNVMRWGINEVDAINYPIGSTTYFITDFDATAGQATGSTGDSGGAVFIKNGGTWELAGIMLAVGVTDGTNYGGSFNGQPSSTSVSNITGSPNAKSVTFSAQIALYEAAIMAAIPEPNSLGLLMLAGGLLFLGKRRKSARVFA